MSDGNSYMYIDYRNNIWKFYKNDNSTLCYKIMYGDSKWTKEKAIDDCIFDFAIYAEDDGAVHILYSNAKREIKYCTMKDKQWVGKTLYKMETDDFDIYNLNVHIIGDEMNIFYLLAGTDRGENGVLMHCIWNGREVKINKLKEIKLISNLREHYTINLNNRNNIDLFFITDEGNELSVNYCSFDNHRWSAIRKLYGIQGENIEFDSIRYNDDIHILNKYKEGSLHFLEHVHLDQRGNINACKVYESEKELKESILFVEGNVLYSCWLEEWKIFYSLFDGERWSKAFFVDEGNEFKVDRYNCFICSEKEASIKKTKVYATDELDFLLLEPSKFVKKMDQTAIVKINEIDKNVIEKVKKDYEEVQVLNLELASIKLEKKEV